MLVQAQTVQMAVQYTNDQSGVEEDPYAHHCHISKAVIYFKRIYQWSSLQCFLKYIIDV